MENNEQLKIRREDLGELLAEVITPEYEIEEKEDSVIAKYFDPYLFEEIIIERQTEEGLKEDGKGVWQTDRYKIWIEKADVNNEIITSTSCHDCFEDCEYYHEDGCKITDEQTETEVKEHESKKKIKVKGFGYELTIEPVISEVVCYLNVTHAHYYKGYMITATSTDKDLVRTILKARDILFDIYHA